MTLPEVSKGDQDQDKNAFQLQKSSSTTRKKSAQFSEKRYEIIGWKIVIIVEKICIKRKSTKEKRRQLTTKRDFWGVQNKKGRIWDFSQRQRNIFETWKKTEAARKKKCVEKWKEIFSLIVNLFCCHQKRKFQSFITLSHHILFFKCKKWISSLPRHNQQQQHEQEIKSWNRF